MFDINVFRSDPSVYYSMARDFIYDIDTKKPSVVHRVLAQLEQMNILHAIITQNIDLLHQKAGSKKVIEIHGSPAIHSCPSCKWQTGFYDILDTVKSKDRGLRNIPFLISPFHPISSPAILSACANTVSVARACMSGG